MVIYSSHKVINISPKKGEIDMKNKKVFSRIQMNVFMAIIGIFVLISSSMMLFLGGLSEAIQTVSMIIAVLGLIFVISQCMIKVEKNDERSYENAAKAGDFAALVLQTALTLVGVVFIFFRNFLNERSYTLVIFMLLGLLIMVRALAFIKYEKAGE